MKILILCTGNSCRSQMAHGFLQSFDKNLFVQSAGTEASGKLNEKAVFVMKEAGIDISNHTSDQVEKYLTEEWDYVITVCGGANENCPAFSGKVKNRLHIGFDDPSHLTGNPDFIMAEFRRVRDEIKDAFYDLYLKINSNPIIMDEKEKARNIVKEKYAKIASQDNKQNTSSCGCGSGCCDEIDYTIFSESYHQISGYNKEADLGLGCGLPTEFANIKEGDYVLDLGSGAGNDCFVARSLTGDKGKVIGLDFTETMIEKANSNLLKTNFQNIEFVLGDIEKMPFNNNSFDVVISNCVLNLVPDKAQAFAEIYRVLKPGGHFCISDVVISGELPEKIRKDAEMYAGCVSGAIEKEKYTEIIENSGFSKIQIHKEKEIELPNTLLLNYISLDELREFKKKRTGIFSITVYAEKKSCCCCSCC